MELRLLPIFSLFALRVVTAQGLPQMCYIDANQLAPDFIIPCWTSYSTPHYSCCMVGDKCLHQNACYNLSTGITYEYGCTDPSYKDDNCPSKCNLDRKKSNWAGLLFCDGTNGTPKDTWVGPQVIDDDVAG
ncbi:hypothetical protein CC80DRAFT_81283 [Byssothecium circinans]|uniref:Endo-1,3(4)-beta-glucanase 1 carbohydrate binding domain-containing protein n=1 Tax=Byssothecium circinans TaxID=147558 RepID=A0A6A5TTV4_9PLEO|nr:hypothetical protein CC80DRAFT_81283 [Byssothecium circinans]